MEIYHEYNIQEYNFLDLFRNLFMCENLQFLHVTGGTSLDLFKPVGKDSDTLYHNIFYLAFCYN